MTTPVPAHPPQRAALAHRAVLVVFAANGTAFAAWASRIPDAKIALGLSPGQLGLTLLFASVGSLLGLPASGWVTDRFGAARAVAIGLAITVVGLLGVGVGVSVSDSRWLVAGALFAVGLGNGLWDVGMNLEGASVERLMGRTTMPHYHAAFSGGTVASALVGAAMSFARVPVLLHLALVSVIIVAATERGRRSFLPRRLEADDAVTSEPAGTAQPASRPSPGSTAEPAATSAESADRTRPPSSHPLGAWREPRTLLIGLFTLVAAFTEGTANDWVSVAFVEGYDLPPWAGVLAFATFLTFMTTGRLIGTRLLDRWGRVPVLRVMLVAAGIGSILVVAGPAPLAYAGAAIWGIGTALGFPVGMSAAADDEARAPARISVVATIAYGAFLGGPPLLGFLGDRVGVLHSLLAVGALLLVALAVVPAVREPDRREGLALTANSAGSRDFGDEGGR